MLLIGTIARIGSARGKVVAIRDGWVDLQCADGSIVSAGEWIVIEETEIARCRAEAVAKATPKPTPKPTPKAPKAHANVPTQAPPADPLLALTYSEAVAIGKGDAWSFAVARADAPSGTKSRRETRALREKGLPFGEASKSDVHYVSPTYAATYRHAAEMQAYRAARRMGEKPPSNWR